MATTNEDTEARRESIVVYFSGDDLYLYDRIVIEAKRRRQKISAFMKAAVESHLGISSLRDLPVEGDDGDALQPGEPDPTT